MEEPRFFEGIKGFQWDEGNSAKNWHRHRVTQAEAEEIFFNRPFVVKADVKHGGQEARFYGLGRTDESRQLMVVFTLRGSLLRVISARPMSRRERRIYEKA